VDCLRQIVKDRRHVAGGVQDSENLDPTFDGPVEDQAVFKSLHLPDTKVGKLPSPKLLPLAKLRHGGKPLKTGIQCLKETDCGFAISLRDIQKMFVGIAIGSRP